MAYLNAGGYVRPVTAKTAPKPRALRAPLASALMGDRDPFGFSEPASSSLSRLAPEGGGPTRYEPPKVRPVAPVAPRPEAPQTPTVSTTFTPPKVVPGFYDLNTDPALQQAYAYTGRADEEARAQAVKDRTVLVEQAGLPELAGALGLGDNVAGVARTNPFSTAANLRHSYETVADDLSRQNTVNRENFDEAANQQNLFYSGYRDRELGRLADAFRRAQQENTRTYQGGLHDLGSAVLDAAARISAAETAALSGSEAARIQAEQEARNRGIQLALASGYSFAGFDANGNPILNPPPADTGGDEAPVSDTSGAAPVGSTIGLADEGLRRYVAGQLQRRTL